MTPTEYSELVTFLASKFDGIDVQFEAMKGRLTRVEVSHEETRHQVQVLAEGLTALRSEMRGEFVAVRGEMREGFASVWSEFGAVRTEMAEGFAAVRKEMRDGFEGQGKLIRGLSARVGRWEGHQA